MKYYLENLNILSQRFPYLYMLLLSINKKQYQVPSIKPSNVKIASNTDTIFVYKCSSIHSYLELIKWLKTKSKKLIFIEDNITNLYKFLHLKEANYLLSNENVSFHFFQKLEKLLDEITPTTKSRNIEVITFAKETKTFQKLKNEILQDSLISYFANHDRIYSYKIFKNFYSNFDKLKTSFLINKLKKAFKNRPAIICGAGPSLKYSFEILKKLENKALIMAGGSAITCLSKENILPHLGVIIDPNLEEYKRMKDSQSFEIPMIYSTRVNNGVFNTFNGPLGYIKAGICGFFEIWLEKELKIPGRHIYNKNEKRALSVTTVSLMIAKLLGCNPIILDGVDLAYSENKMYALDIIEDNNLKQDREDIGERPLLSKDKNNKDIFTNLKWEIESKWIATFATYNKNIEFINATKSGLKIDNVTDMSLEEVEKKYLQNQFDFKAYMHTLCQTSELEKAKKLDFNELKIKLKNSFLKCRDYLKEINVNDPEYKAILAKEELPDEIAYRYFLFEIAYTLHKFYPDAKNEPKLLEATNFFLKEFETLKS